MPTPRASATTAPIACFIEAPSVVEHEELVPTSRTNVLQFCYRSLVSAELRRGSLRNPEKERPRSCHCALAHGRSGGAVHPPALPGRGLSAGVAAGCGRGRGVGRGRRTGPLRLRLA